MCRELGGGEQGNTAWKNMCLLCVTTVFFQRAVATTPFRGFISLLQRLLYLIFVFDGGVNSTRDFALAFPNNRLRSRRRKPPR